jgi:AcrR family transcriptional regulator
LGIAERKEREFKRREREILEAALRLFGGDDWQLVTIERIAQEAEIGKGTVYLHFPSKEVIYGRLALDFQRDLLDRWRGIDRALPVLERLRAAIGVLFDAHRGGRPYQRLVDHCNREDFRRRLDETTRGELEQVDAEINALIAGELEEGIAAGIFPDRPLATLMLGPHTTLMGAVRLLSGNYACAALPEGDALVAEVTRFVLAGLMFQERVPEPAPAPEGGAVMQRS